MVSLTTSLGIGAFLSAVPSAVGHKFATKCDKLVTIGEGAAYRLTLRTMSAILRELRAGRTLSSHPVDVGQRSEAIIFTEFVKRGYRVLVPFGSNHRYDFALDLEDRFLRVQCKTGRIRRGAVLFNARSVQVNTQRAYTRTYEGQIDLFAVYCPENDRVYAVPAEEATTTVGCLRIDPTANNQAKGVRWAADYELPA